MKVSIIGVLCLCATMAWGAAGLKIAYVDLQKALQTVEAGKKAKAELEKELVTKKSQLDKEQEKLQKEAEAFEKKAAILNEAARTKQQAELQKKLVDLQKRAMDTQMELNKRERDLVKPVLDELRAIIDGMGKERSYQLILEKNEGAVLYAEAGSDLTDEVIEKFNARRKKK